MEFNRLFKYILIIQFNYEWLFMTLCIYFTHIPYIYIFTFFIFRGADKNALNCSVFSFKSKSTRWNVFMLFINFSSIFRFDELTLFLVITQSEYAKSTVYFKKVICSFIYFNFFFVLGNVGNWPWKVL